MPTSEVETRVRKFVESPLQMMIGGRWVDAASGRTLDSVDPATEELLATVPQAGTEDVHRAVAAARAAFNADSPWRRMSPSLRGRVLHRIGDLVLEFADELALLESLDNGKPVRVARSADLPLAADLFHYMAGHCTKTEGDTIPMSLAEPGRYLSFTAREPVGVVAQIISWNFPLLMAAWKLGPALAAGCTVILKPAEQTPLTALRLGELCQQAGLPDGVLSILTGYGDVGAALAAHPGVDKVAFTGSAEVGRQIVRAAAGNLKKVSLELGGKSPNIVYADADLDRAVAGSAEAIFFNAGECCVAGSRLFVQRPVFDEVLAGIKARAGQIEIGPGTEPGTEMGPLVSRAQYERVTGYIAGGLAEGAKVVSGGKRHGKRGYFVQPTVLTGTTPRMRVEREEIFGPVVVAVPFDTPEEVTMRANDTQYGLGAGIFTRDLAKAMRTANLLRAGTVYINTWNVFDAALPFGGYKQSGWGRELGHEALRSYLETKTIIADIGASAR
jgi:phenylacetaldehyde dehydrogenase